jgi:hypothetical protein
MIVRGVAVAAAVTLLAVTAAGCGGSKKDSASDSKGNSPASSTPAGGGTGGGGGGKDFKPLNAKEKAEFLKGWKAMVDHPIPPAKQDAYIAEAGKACSGAYGYDEKPVEAGVAKSLKLNSSDASNFVMAISQACRDRGHH